MQAPSLLSLRRLGRISGFVVRLEIQRCACGRRVGSEISAAQVRGRDRNRLFCQGRWMSIIYNRSRATTFAFFVNYINTRTHLQTKDHVYNFSIEKCLTVRYAHNITVATTVVRTTVQHLRQETERYHHPHRFNRSNL